jgi:hypothetical protein
MPFALTISIVDEIIPLEPEVSLHLTRDVPRPRPDLMFRSPLDARKPLLIIQFSISVAVHEANPGFR